MQVIIIPIYWNKRAEEKAAVLAAAERVAGVLRRGGVRTALDASDERMPGAKFKHWRASLLPPKFVRTLVAICKSAALHSTGCNFINLWSRALSSHVSPA